MVGLLSFNRSIQNGMTLLHGTCGITSTIMVDTAFRIVCTVWPCTISTVCIKSLNSNRASLWQRWNKVVRATQTRRTTVLRGSLINSWMGNDKCNSSLGVLYHAGWCKYVDPSAGICSTTFSKAVMRFNQSSGGVFSMIAHNSWMGPSGILEFLGLWLLLFPARLLLPPRGADRFGVWYIFRYRYCYWAPIQ